MALGTSFAHHVSITREKCEPQRGTNRELIKKNRRGRARGREAVKNNEFVRDSRSGGLSEQPRPSNRVQLAVQPVVI